MTLYQVKALRRVVCAMEDMKNEAEAEVKKLQGMLKNECDERDKLQIWLDRFAGLGLEDAGETPEVILEAVVERIDNLEARFVKTQELIERYCREECEYGETCIPLGNNCPLMIFREQWGATNEELKK